MLLSFIMAMKKKWADTSTLSQAFLYLDNHEQVYNFLHGLLTSEEMNDLQQRFDIAARLIFGHSYVSIQQELGVSSTTVARVAKSIKMNPGAYESVIKPMYNITEGGK